MVVVIDTQKTDSVMESESEATPGKSDQPSSYQWDLEDIIPKVARAISDDDQIERLGRALGFEYPDIKRFIRTNLIEGEVTTRGTKIMLRKWAEKVSVTEEQQALRDALRKAGLVQIEDKCLPNQVMATGGGIADDLLAKLAEHIETDEQVEALGRALGFLEPCIIRYTHTNRLEGRVTCKGTRDMLFDWRQRVDPSYQHLRLKEALTNAKIVMLADTYLKDNIPDTISEDLLKGKVVCNRTRIMVVGPAGVGKTSFINRLTNQSFDQEEKSTVGTVNTHTTSQWKLETVPRDELAESLARCQNTSREERKALETTSHLPLLSTKRVSSQGMLAEPPEPNEGIEEVKEYAKSISLERIHNVTSSANDIIYSIWDFGGQEIYYITHPLFLSWRSLYIAVFPLHKIITENALREEDSSTGQLEGCPTRTYRTMLDLMHFWMMSIYIHAVAPDNMKDPKILLIGTFCNDDKSKSIKDRNISELKDMVTDKPYGSQVILSVVEVDNKSSSHDQISQIQGKIDVLIKDADYMKEELPIKWRIFLDKTKDLRQDTLKLTEAREIMSEMGIRADKDVQDVLKFCHDAGHLIYHQGCELIILHPEVLNSFVSNIIAVITPEKLNGELREHWRRLKKKGVLSMDLIKEVWKQHKGKDDELDMVIDMMIQFDLMCEIKDDQRKSQGRRFFVPCRSSPTLHPEEEHGRDDEFQFIIDFEHLLPDGFLHRLYVRMAQWAMNQKGPKDPSFHCREMLFYIDGKHRVIMSNDIEGSNAHKIKVTVYAISAYGHPDPNAKVNFKSSFMKDLSYELDYLKKTWARRINFTIRIECPKPTCQEMMPLEYFWRNDEERVTCDKCSCSILVTDVPECIRRSCADARITSSTGLLGDARRRTVESAQRSVDPPQQPSNSSANASLHGQQAFYDIYLVYSEDTEHVRNVKAIIHRNGWKMTTPADSRLGVPKMDSIGEALKTCSHVVLVITEEDCRKNDSERTMTIEMAFQSSSEKGMAGRVIPIRCCDERHLPDKLKSLTNACVIDANLEDRLKKSINVNIKKRREESMSVGSDDSSHPNASSRDNPSQRRVGHWLCKFI